jgi:CheY-like chemotaxis protein
VLSTRVLVIDADALVARAIGRALVGSHEVAIEVDPTSALRRLASGEHFDVVLCDRRAAANEIMRAVQRRPLFILMSGTELEPGESDAVLRKPFRTPELCSLIDRLIAGPTRSG